MAEIKKKYPQGKRKKKRRSDFKKSFMVADFLTADEFNALNTFKKRLA